MKTIEKIVKNLILTSVENKFDPLQLAYKTLMGVDDTTLFISNTLYKHQGKKTQTNKTAQMKLKEYVSLFCVNISWDINQLDTWIREMRNNKSN